MYEWIANYLTTSYQLTELFNVRLYLMEISFVEIVRSGDVLLSLISICYLRPSVDVLRKCINISKTG